MPPTHVSPALRRRISDDARELLRSALESSDLEPLWPAIDRPPHLLSLPLGDRLQNFRGRLRLDLLVDSSEGAQPVSSFELRLAVATSAYLVRFSLERLDAEVSVANQSGVTTSWITTSDGHHQQLQTFIDDPHAGASSRPLIRSLLAMVDMLDLQDLFAACTTATRVRVHSSATGEKDVFYATSDKNSYVFAFSGSSGQPESITIAPLTSAESSPVLRLHIDQYIRLSTGIDIPAGVQSDVQLMIDTALRCVAQWSPEGQQQIAGVFASLDTDDDGWISGYDMQRQLVDGAGVTEQRAQSIVAELARLVGGANDPAEEMSLREFSGVWVSLLADGHAVSDPRNEPGVLAALDRLFFDE